MHISEVTFNSSIFSTHLDSNKTATLDYLFPTSQQDAIDSHLKDREVHLISSPETTALFFSYFEDATLHDQKKQYGLSLLSLNKAYYVGLSHDLISNLINAIIKDTEKSNIALKELNDYIPNHPDDLYALDIRASLYHAKDEIDLLIQDIDQIIEKNFPFSLYNLRYRGVYYYNKQEYTKALKDFNAYLDILLKNHDYQVLSFLNNYPKCADILEIILLRALIYKELGGVSNQENALKDLHDLSTVFSTEELTLKLETSYCDLQKVKLHTFIELGEVRSKQKLYQQAILNFNHSLKFTDNLDLKIHVLQKIGFCYEMNNQLEEAISTYQDLIKLNALFFDYHRVCANLYMSLQKTSQALNYYNLFISLWDKHNNYISYDNDSIKQYVENNPDCLGILDVFYMKAVIYHQRFDYQSCLISLNRFLETLSLLDLTKPPINSEFLLNKKFSALNLRLSVYMLEGNYNFALVDLNTIFNDFEKKMTLTQKIKLKTLNLNINSFLGRFINAEQDRKDLLNYNRKNFYRSGNFK